MESPEILDRAHLARYTMGDAVLEQEVLGLFIGQVPETVAMLRNSGDAEAWMRAAHTIKGSARAVGAWKLAEAAERAENRCRQQERWQSLADEIEAAVEEVRLCIVANKKNVCHPNVLSDQCL
ncbi:MAG: Hpt domain-containing protein [Hyphomicrobiaceae bacterium]